MLNQQRHWAEDNYQALLAEIRQIKTQLYAQLPPEAQQASKNSAAVLAAVTEQHGLMLDHLCAVFALNRFERQLLLLCLGIELDPEIASLCVQLHNRPLPTLSLALHCFDGHCESLSPQAPLVYFQLITLHDDHASFMQRSLTIDQWALFYLSGTPVMPPLLAGTLQAITLIEPELSVERDSVAALRHFRDDQGGNQSGDQDQTGIQLIGQSDDRIQQLAAQLANTEERALYHWNLHHLPQESEQKTHYLSLLEREVVTRQCLLLINCQCLCDDNKSPADGYAITHWLESLLTSLPQLCLLYADQALRLAQWDLHHHSLPALPLADQQQLWQQHLDSDQYKDSQAWIDHCSGQYPLTPRQIRSIAARINTEKSVHAINQRLAQYSREQLRQDLHGLAQILPPSTLDWERLILADSEKQTLKAIVAQVQQRQQVYEQWGFAEHLNYGLGTAALFSGSSGTGKTLAVRMIANALQRDIYQVDLSRIVDKYIGETEKKLDTLFAAAENSGAILLFDEADALFGKRTQVQDAKDRYANMSVSFLLQRMEHYSGLSILTTNLRSAIDNAFTRRLNFIVQFSFPSAEQRQQIWQYALPAKVPTDNINYPKLARLSLAGGVIRNITLRAAFIAAEKQQTLNMRTLREAAAQEFLKMDKTLDEKLVADW
ncbi:MAG: ATP-binding protein [Pseudomonadota bacterium]